MLVARKVENRLRGLLQVYGTPRIKTRLWDGEFSRGRWDSLDATPGDCIYPHVERYANHGRILDLGCGSGSTANEIDATAYREYIGVDISEVALEKARRRSEENGRTHQHHYVRSDILGYAPSRPFDVIVFRDSIYYVPWSQIPDLLHRYSPFLTGNGVFIMRMSNGADTYKPVADAIACNFDVIEAHAVDEPNAVVMIFRPRCNIALLTGGEDRHYAFGLAMALASQEVSLDVIGSDEVDSPEMHHTAQLRFLNLRGNQRPDAGVWRKLWRVAAYYLRLVRYAATARPTIFHILWNNKFLAFDRTLLTLYYKILGKQIVLTAHNVNAGRRDATDSLLNRLTLKTQYRLADHIFVHTDKMRTQLVQEFAVRERRVTVIPYGINNALPDTGLSPAAARARLGIDRDSRTILFFGSIAPYKGLEYLVAAFQMLAAGPGDYRLIIAGRPKKQHQQYWNRLARTIERDPSRERIIRKIHYIPDQDTEIYFKAADVLVLPYTEIFQSGVLFLGYSFGLPVIASDVGSLRDDVVEGTTGFVCKPRDTADLARTIEGYFSSDLFTRLNARRCEIRDYAVRRHSWDAVGQMTRRVYAELL
jgi:glycosyltransferase involved in cell wall biosynthesis